MIAQTSLSALTLLRYRPSRDRLTLPDVCCDLLWLDARSYIVGPVSHAMQAIGEGQDVSVLRLDPQVARYWLGVPLHELTAVRSSARPQRRPPRCLGPDLRPSTSECSEADELAAQQGASLGTAAAAPPIGRQEADATLAALKPPTRERPVIAIVGLNDATETTDYVIPVGILRRADIADVMMLATDPGPVSLYPALAVEPDATIATFDGQHPPRARSWLRASSIRTRAM